MKKLREDIPNTMVEVGRGNSGLFDVVGPKGPNSAGPYWVATCSLLFSRPENCRT